jgi:hypothetical protein
MTIEETFDLLTVAAAYDRRTVGQGDAVAWHAVVGSYGFDDCRAAVIAHYTESTDWLMPAHVRNRVKAIRDRRIQDAEIPPPPRETLDDPAAYSAALHAARVAAADGRDPEAAMRQAVRGSRRLELEGGSRD